MTSTTHTPSAGLGAAAAPSRPVDAGIPRTRTRVLLLAAAVVVAVAANTVIALSAVAAGASAAFMPLSLALYGPFTAVGLLVAWAGWYLIASRARRAGSILRVLVPVLTLVSFVPDVALAILGFIPNASLTGTIGLALMHLVVVGVAVPVSQRMLPARDRA